MSINKTTKRTIVHNHIILNFSPVHLGCSKNFITFETPELSIYFVSERQ